MKIACPSCGADVEFQSAQSVFAVCAHCASSLVRRDVDVENLGKMAELQADSSPLQIGTSGQIDGRAFQIVGRLKIGYDEGFWHEWRALQDDGSSAWIAEAQGFWMISREAPEAAKLLPRAGEPEIGDANLRIGDMAWAVDDIKHTVCLFAEGELPFPAPVGRKARSIDLRGRDGAFASLDYSDEGVAMYVGRYAEFGEFQFRNLRALDGWY